jgi:XTP/dITP diphosphohydrolase
LGSDVRLLLASQNRAKAAEIACILSKAGLRAEVLTLADFPGITLPPETGRTFADNALEKARHAAAATSLPSIADDSGLEVDALDGKPGLLSARYAGKGASDADRNAMVLDQIRDIPAERRTARFRCAAAYAEPGGFTLLAEGACEGRIALAPSGSGGFGYDPIFIPEGEERTVAQLSPAEKHDISHRGRAFRKLAELLRARGLS